MRHQAKGIELQEAPSRPLGTPRSTVPTFHWTAWASPAWVRGLPGAFERAFHREPLRLRRPSPADRPL